MAQQTALAEEALRSKPDAVVFTPTDVKAMVPVVGKFAAAGIPVINVNDRLAGGNVAAYVGSDDVAIARETARVLLKAMGGKGTVIILEGPKTAPSSALRVRGFNEALKEFPGVKLLATGNGNYARKSARRRDEWLRAQVQGDRRRARRQRPDGGGRARCARARPGARRWWSASTPARIRST